MIRSTATASSIRSRRCRACLKAEAAAAAAARAALAGAPPRAPGSAATLAAEGAEAALVQVRTRAAIARAGQALERSRKARSAIWWGWGSWLLAGGAARDRRGGRPLRRAAAPRRERR